MTLLSVLVAICAMVVLLSAHRWQYGVFRALLCSTFALSLVAHGLNTKVWLGASLFYVAVSCLTIDLFHSELRRWLGTWRQTLLTVGAVVAIGWGLQTAKLLPLEPAIGMSLAALSLLLAGGLIYATALILNRNALLRLATMTICAALESVWNRPKRHF